MECVFILKILFFLVQLLELSLTIAKVPDDRGKEFGPVPNWPRYNVFGQISAVGVDNSGNVFVFHRGNRQWDKFTFSINNIFVDKDKGPIPNDTIVVLSEEEGYLLKKTGSNLFYLPHGLTVDDDNNIWVTDVALHQVFKFPPLNFSKQSPGLANATLTLGVSLEPGSDRHHFCKPTDVAVDKKTKEFYVSDGYCNARIIKYDEFGNILLILGRASQGFPPSGFYMLQVPHALALDQDKQVLYVADRENFRVVSYFFQSGKFKSSYAEELKSRVFSVAYSPVQNGLLFVLANNDTQTKMVAVYNAETGKLILSFSPKINFFNPHDVAVSHDGRYCYVVELNPYKVWKFNLDMEIISKINKQSSIESNKTSIRSNENGVLQEPLPVESKLETIKNNFEINNSFWAVALVVTVVAISFILFMLHYLKRKAGYRRYETRRLILDDDEIECH